MKPHICLAPLLLAAPAFAQTAPPPPMDAAIAITKNLEPCRQERLVVYFAPNEADLTAQAYRALDAAAENVAACVTWEIRASAFSHDAPTETAGETLSQARLDAVVQALAASGVEAPMVSIDAQPATSNGMAARRVEIVLDAVPRLNHS